MGPVRPRRAPRGDCAPPRAPASTGRSARRGRAPIAVPRAISSRDPATISTQAAVGRILLDLSRIRRARRADRHRLARRLRLDEPRRLDQQGRRVRSRGGADVRGARAGSALAWRVSPTGRHVELGISEMNLFLALGQFGLTRDFQREQLFPIGTLYDPFVVPGPRRASSTAPTRAAASSCSARRRGITLSREGGAHQSTITPSIGLELPGIVYAEPTFGRELEWLLLDATGGACRSPTARRCTCASRRSRSTRRRSPSCARRGGRRRSAPTCSPARSGCGSPASRTRRRRSSPPAAR